MEDHKLSTERLFDEIKNAINKNSEILEINFDLELENDLPKIFSIEEDENWGIFAFFLKVKDQDLFYVVNIDDCGSNEVLSGYCYNKYKISLDVTSIHIIDDLINSFKVKPSYKNDYHHPNNLAIPDALKSAVGFNFDLQPNFLQNQLLEFLDIMDSDKSNFQKLLNENYGFLSIGIPNNDLVEDLTPLPNISNELIKRLSEYNLSIQFGKIIKN
ncbi:hypothetical protein ASG22_17310 [Chryseobacterium sp. Leaf405]|uniref:hypothetical protein n=1 Tax=Chryseobacterium sp. Leaf405 TaxID=1736367 RepID=UPI0006F673D5|nr:hypothetical protein [Chryseobacterium sp. Leaf405]KQT33859.1 hypothetical protein ASG22_17310 [Chryseobacterium sp. Leaf405]